MSGLAASLAGVETGLPPLTSSKWSPPARRATKIPWIPFPVSSEKVTHGTVGVFGVSVPAATRGSSASRAASAFSEQALSAALLAAHAPKPLAPERSSTLTCPAVPDPTATQWKPPSAAPSATALAAKTCSLSARPRPLLSFSYQTTQGTASPGPVNAKSGSTPLRLGSMLSVGSPAGSGAELVLARRSRPTCCQQNVLTLALADGLRPVHGW